MAQRIESVAPPGGVMVSESTARLVEDVAVLEGTGTGADPRTPTELVSARQLLRTVADPVLSRRRTVASDRAAMGDAGAQWNSRRIRLPAGDV